MGEAGMLSLNSFGFVLCFMPVVVGGFWILQRRAGREWALNWMLAASVVFDIMAGLATVVAVSACIMLNYCAARVLLSVDSKRTSRRNTVFVAAISVNLLVLGTFKYAGTLLQLTQLGSLLSASELHSLLPLGISFLTLQNIAFLDDVRCGYVTAVSVRDFVLFSVFFPRSTAGPIIHYQEFVPQLGRHEPGDPSTELAVGICLFSLGLFKKTVLADSLGQLVSPVFDVLPPDQPPTLLTSWVGSVAYVIQLYFDFSGYSDMALGAARMVGIRLPMNFDSPLKAMNILEFWRGWHITLTRFLTDYIYTPLMVSLTRYRKRRGKSVLRGDHSTAAAILILIGGPAFATMLVSGIWHGTGWNYVIWGLLHGLYLTIYQAWRLERPRWLPKSERLMPIVKVFSRLLTLIAVTLAQVFFRASSTSSAIRIIGGMVGLNGVLPFDAQLLRHSGVALNWTTISALWDPLTPCMWVAASLLVVWTAPNSLELLSRYGPALDFRVGKRNTVRSTTGLPRVSAEPVSRGLGPSGRVGTAFRRLVEATAVGVIFNRLVAFIAAVLAVLGVSALGREATFIYQQF